MFPEHDRLAMAATCRLMMEVTMTSSTGWGWISFSPSDYLMASTKNYDFAPARAASYGHVDKGDRLVRHGCRRRLSLS
jgi:hypothetical protein